jgi:rRNA maturation endonuclease Nob1
VNFLVVGGLLALATLAYVMVPLFRGAPAAAPAAPPLPPRRVDVLDSPLAALQEIEFDRQTGKLSDADYQALKERYTKRVAERLAAQGVEVPTTEGGAVDLAELLVQQVRASAAVCPACGPRPESEATFCSDCGRYLARQCSACGHAIELQGARFCPDCGHDLAQG